MIKPAEFISRVDDRLKAMNLGAREMCEKAGLNGNFWADYILRVKKGERDSLPKDKPLAAIAEALDVPVEYLRDEEAELLSNMLNLPANLDPVQADTLGRVMHFFAVLGREEMHADPSAPNFSNWDAKDVYSAWPYYAKLYWRTMLGVIRGESQAETLAVLRGISAVQEVSAEEEQSATPPPHHPGS